MMKNARLEKLFTLSHKVTVYVPATKNDENGAHPINNKKYVDEIAKILSNTFGGATSTDAIGYWVSDKKCKNGEVRGLERENTRLVFAYAESLEKIDVVIDWCELLKDKLKQDNIALEIDNQMYFI